MTIAQHNALQLARTGKSPSQHYAELTARFGNPAYARVDAPANREQKAKLSALAHAHCWPWPMCRMPRR